MKIGLRTVKTAFAFFLSTLIYFIIKLIVPEYSFYFSPFFCAIAAMFSIQPGKNISLAMGKRRLVGTFIGGLTGMLVVFLCKDIKGVGTWPNLIYFIIASSLVFVLIPITLKFKQQDAVFVTLLSYASITIGVHTITELQYGVNRILSTIVGIGIACLISVYRIPRKKQTNVLFTCAVNTLLDDYGISSTMKYKLNYLFDYDIDLVLTSHYSEAELDEYLKGVNIKNKLIVLNGAALFDFNNKTYHNPFNFTIKEKNDIDNILDSNNIFALRYVITNHFNKLNIFYNKELPKHYIDIDESLEYDYTNANVLEDTLITQYQIIDTLENIEKIKNLFSKYLITIRRYNKEYYSLYINSNETSKEKQLIKLNENNKDVISFIFKDKALSNIAKEVYCVENSTDEIKELSDLTLKNNLDVMKKLKKLYLR